MKYINNLYKYSKNMIIIQQALCDYEDVKKETEDLKVKLEQKNADVKTLNEKIHAMSQQLNDSFEKYKEALKYDETNKEKLENLKSEKTQLENSVEKLKESLEEKELNYKLLNSNFNLEKRNKKDLEVFREKMVHLAGKTCEESELNNNESIQNSKVVEHLKKAVEESEHLKNKNSSLKSKLNELELKSNIETDENKSLRFSNDNLQVEIASLKRTISEQSAYLAVISPSSNSSSHDEVDTTLIKPQIESEIKQTSQFNENSKSPILEEGANDDVYESNKKVKRQQIEINRLQNEILILSSQIECFDQNEKQFLDRSRINMQRKEDEIVDLEIKVSKLNQKYSEIEEINLNMKEELKENNNKLNESQNLDQELNNFIGVYKSLSGIDYDQSKERQESLISMRKWLEEQNKVKEDLNRENEHLKQEVNILKSKTLELEKKQREIEKDHTDKNVDNNAKLQNCVFKLEHEVRKVKKLEEKIVKCDEEKKNVRYELDNVTRKLNETKETLKAIEKEHDSKVNELTADNVQLKSFEEEKQKLVDQLDNLNKECNKMKTTITIKNEKINYLKEDMKIQINEIKRKNEEALKEVEEKLEEMKKENEKLKNECLNQTKEEVELKTIYENSVEKVEKLKNQLTNKEMEFNDEKYADAIEIERQGKDEYIKLDAELQELVKEKNKSSEEIKNLENLCKELKNINDDLNKKYSKLIEKNETLSEKYSCNEIMLKEYEKRNQMISDLREAMENTKEKMERIEEENQKLALQKKQADMMLKIEKLKNLSEPTKNLSEPTKTFKISNISFDKQIVVPLSSMSPCCESNVDEDFDDHFKDSDDHLYGAMENGFESLDCSNEMENKLTSSDNQWVFNCSHRYITFMKAYLSSPLCPLKIENRRKFLDIIGIQSCLRRKLYLENTCEESKVSRMNGHSSPNNNHINGYDDEVTNINNPNNSLFEDFLNVLSTKCFECFSMMVGLEEKVDAFLCKIHKDFGTEEDLVTFKETLSDLITRFTTHKNTLYRLRGLLQSVLDGQLDIKSVSEYLHQPLDDFAETSITMKSNYVFNATNNKKTPQNRIRVIRNSSSDSDERANSADDASPQKLRALQNQLKVRFVV